MSNDYDNFVGKKAEVEKKGEAKKEELQSSSEGATSALDDSCNNNLYPLGFPVMFTELPVTSETAYDEDICIIVPA